MIPDATKAEVRNCLGETDHLVVRVTGDIMAFHEWAETSPAIVQCRPTGRGIELRVANLWDGMAAVVEAASLTDVDLTAIDLVDPATDAVGLTLTGRALSG